VFHQLAQLASLIDEEAAILNMIGMRSVGLHCARERQRGVCVCVCGDPNACVYLYVGGRVYD
jgi:hypothetical protein